MKNRYLIKETDYNEYLKNGNGRIILIESFEDVDKTLKDWYKYNDNPEYKNLHVDYIREVIVVDDTDYFILEKVGKP